MTGNALVTGASGFIGKALVRRLIGDAVKVRAFVRSADKLEDVAGQSLEVVEGDITDVNAVEQVCTGIDVVYHIAGAFREANLSDARYDEVNVGGTRNVLRGAARAGVRRVVHCSTSGIHGSISGPPADEDHRLVLDEIYEKTKAEAEIEAIKFGSEHELEVTALRPTQVYGPGDTRLLKLFKMAGAKRTLWPGPGTARYHLLYIDDLVDAFLLAASEDAAVGESFLIGGPQTPSLNDLLTAIAKSLGKQQARLLRVPVWPFMVLGGVCERVCIPLGISPPIYRRRVEFFVKDKAFSIQKARDCLGFDPKFDMNEGLQHPVDWYRETGALEPAG